MKYTHGVFSILLGCLVLSGCNNGNGGNSANIHNSTLKALSTKVIGSDSLLKLQEFSYSYKRRIITNIFKDNQGQDYVVYANKGVDKYSPDTVRIFKLNNGQVDKSNSYIIEDRVNGVVISDILRPNIYTVDNQLKFSYISKDGSLNIGNLSKEPVNGIFELTSVSKETPVLAPSSFANFKYSGNYRSYLLGLRNDQDFASGNPTDMVLKQLNPVTNKFYDTGSPGVLMNCVRTTIRNSLKQAGVASTVLPNGTLVVAAELSSADNSDCRGVKSNDLKIRIDDPVNNIALVNKVYDNGQYPSITALDDDLILEVHISKDGHDIIADPINAFTGDVAKSVILLHDDERTFYSPSITLDKDKKNLLITVSGEDNFPSSDNTGYAYFGSVAVADITSHDPNLEFSNKIKAQLDIEGNFENSLGQHKFTITNYSDKTLKIVPELINQTPAIDNGIHFTFGAFSLSPHQSKSINYMAEQSLDEASSLNSIKNYNLKVSDITNPKVIADIPLHIGVKPDPSSLFDILPLDKYDSGKNYCREVTIGIDNKAIHCYDVDGTGKVEVNVHLKDYLYKYSPVLVHTLNINQFYSSDNIYNNSVNNSLKSSSPTSFIDGEISCSERTKKVTLNLGNSSLTPLTNLVPLVPLIPIRPLRPIEPEPPKDQAFLYPAITSYEPGELPDTTEMQVAILCSKPGECSGQSIKTTSYTQIPVRTGDDIGFPLTDLSLLPLVKEEYYTERKVQEIKLNEELKDGDKRNLAVKIVPASNGHYVSAKMEFNFERKLDSIYIPMLPMFSYKYGGLYEIPKEVPEQPTPKVDQQILGYNSYGQARPSGLSELIYSNPDYSYYHRYGRADYDPSIGQQTARYITSSGTTRNAQTITVTNFRYLGLKDLIKGDKVVQVTLASSLHQFIPMFERSNNTSYEKAVIRILRKASVLYMTNYWDINYGFTSENSTKMTTSTTNGAVYSNYQQLYSNNTGEIQDLVSIRIRSTLPTNNFNPFIGGAPLDPDFRVLGEPSPQQDFRVPNLPLKNILMTIWNRPAPQTAIGLTTLRSLGDPTVTNENSKFCQFCLKQPHLDPAWEIHYEYGEIDPVGEMVGDVMYYSNFPVLNYENPLRANVHGITLEKTGRFYPFSTNPAHGPNLTMFTLKAFQ